MAKRAPKLLIIEARFYHAIADELARGAIAVLDAEGAKYDRVAVPGVLETPAALALAVEAGGYDGYVMLGCVIRGETSHYDIVAVQSARAIVDLAVQHRLAVGNGILTVDNRDQAWARAGTGKGDKGGVAAQAALAMIDVKAKLEKAR